MNETEEQLQAQLIWKLNKLDAARQWELAAEREKSDAERCKRHGISCAENHLSKESIYRALAAKLEREAQQ